LVIGGVGLLCFTIQMCCCFCLQSIQCCELFCIHLENETSTPNMIGLFCDNFSSLCSSFLGIFTIMSPLMLTIGGILLFTLDELENTAIGISSVSVAGSSIVLSVCSCLSVCCCVIFGKCFTGVAKMIESEDYQGSNYRNDRNYGSEW
jgi:hypothetical protein